jgi:hypothetical protein
MRGRGRPVTAELPDPFWTTPTEPAVSAEQAPLLVPPERAVIACGGDQGSHMVQAPPVWAMETLAELD